MNENVKIACGQPIVQLEDSRIEELIGDLIRHVAKTHVITSGNQEEAAQMKRQLGKLECQVESILKNQKTLSDRVAKLERTRKVYS